MNRVLRKGFRTIVFDGWEDSTSCAFVDVLLRVERLTTNFRTTSFLESILTGSDRMDSNDYAMPVKSAMSEYGGMEKSAPLPATL